MTYWYSNYQGIGYCVITPTVYAECVDNSVTAFKGYVSLACSQWNNHEVSVDYTTSSDAYFNVKGGKYDVIKTYDASVTSEIAGVCHYSTNYVGNYDYNGSYKSGYEMGLYSQISIVTDATSNYTGVAAHELGHALGWLGHSTSISDVMYKEDNNISNLTQRDYLHLNQVY